MLQSVCCQMNNKTLGKTAKPNHWLAGGSGRFFIVLNNDSHPEPDGTTGQPAVW